MDTAILVGVRGEEVELLKISAKTDAGLPALLELEDPRGDDVDVVVVESKLSAEHDTQLNALVQDGRLRNGDTLLQIEGFGGEAVCAKVEYFCPLYY